MSDDTQVTLQAITADQPSIKDFGAIGDGTLHLVSEWYTPGAAAYRGYADLAAVQVDYPHVRQSSDSIDWAATQAGLDACAGSALRVPQGTYLLTDTCYVNAGTTVYGVGVGDNWAVTSSVKGARFKLSGEGVKRIWTDVGAPDTPAGTLVDAPVAIMFALCGSGIMLSNFAVEGGSATDGSDTWFAGIFNAGVRRTLLDRIDVVGTFLKAGVYVDGTWSKTNTALRNIHRDTYGRDVPSDQASNEFTYQNCWFKGGNWGLYAKGTDRTDTSADIWSPGGVSDLVGFASRIDNTPLGERPNFPEDSGGYYRDFHNGFQNRRHFSCRIGSQSAYGIFLDRGRFEQFDGFYGETRAERCVTQAVEKTIGDLGVVAVPANFGGDWGNGNPVTYRVYLTDSSRIDVLQQAVRIGATWTTETGSFVLSGVNFDQVTGRAYLMTSAVQGSISAGQALSQAAGQTAANGGFYATDRSEAVQTSGQTAFKTAGPLNAFFGPTTHTRYLRTAGLASTSRQLLATASDEVSFNCDSPQFNVFVNRYGFNADLSTYRMRYLGTSLESYNEMNLGSASRKCGTVFARTGSISTSDARLKTPVRAFTAQELGAAMALGGEIGFYQFLAAIEDKRKAGENAREHCGMTVQRVIEVFQEHGLDPFNYSFICHDCWDDEFETVEGQRVQTRSAGDEFSFRISGLILFITRGLVHMSKDNQTRLDALDALLRP
ncbi:tail fiber domain-containing protein [Pseudomonas cremoricolorata]|uniref:tail fiber domain-containing protein n=1 Tax=Pseudomonas cremoricolorata TaxID=157783 RepID=UPI00056F7E91|nr:tail fiber domain-containing protein [Pseudomonas cremoricolorata]